MFFRVLANGERPPRDAVGCAFLLTDNWDDWFKYNTLYQLIVFDGDGKRHVIGGVKIGQFNMGKEQRRPALPTEFDELGEEFFSIGQDDSYYEDLNQLGDEARDFILRGLRDMAFDPDRFQLARDESVTGVSLLRSVTPATVKGQFSRMSRGGARLSKYHFSYTAPKPRRVRVDPPVFTFDVEPGSNPPTNVHVVIGRNGVGKTHLLNNMTRAIVDSKANVSEVGSFEGDPEDILADQVFANLVSVSFSAFDTFEPLPNRQNKSDGVLYTYVGLKRIDSADKDRKLVPKSPARLATEFANSVLVCRQGARASRWRRALETLETDRVFSDAEVVELANEELGIDDAKAEARRVFDLLSSGHKIVLLTITRLVETVEERTLVLLDEPEAHLHPPLLSAFVRALSDLLVNRNGVAIIATHSPVVLQEVPLSCAWKIRRVGERAIAERPEIETFGENVGILTREIFGLEVTQSGFHKLLTEEVKSGLTFRQIVEKFGDELGGEARALVRGLIAARDANNN
ncbi:AAA family ATPase [Agrobacterium sp. B1(2019)]|nr:AAA family ATPase [Agrobacterium sp. B1(2019)]